MYISNSKARKVVYLMMQHITGIPQSAFFSSLEDTILPKPRSFYRCFVEALSLQTLGFSVQTIKGKVARALILKSFLKFIVWVSKWLRPRKLEKECARNIELQWLLCAIIPNYHSISDFRKQNPSGLKSVQTLCFFLKDAG
jgi:hypothetical protein